jgi:hypothetical protein
LARDSSLSIAFLSLFLPAVVAGCGEAASSLALQGAVRFDPCTPVVLAPEADATTAQRGGVQAAALLWNARAQTRLSVRPPEETASLVAPALTVRFQAAAAPSHGFFDPDTGDVFINDDLSAHPLAVTIAHELGHAFGLAHVAGRPSVMALGNLDVEPNDADVAAVAGLWGRCDPAFAGPQAGSQAGLQTGSQD